ncbi:acyl carrier protein [Allorhizocola rhizosphaerae]|uniref:acyl carrier protein n=1 Tax=Allorhizocola rhizosphaerae TaxID=1872709 RepID=UPI000E3D4B6C|nr:acyl carrier protein [Allorhizocola rhizosphaerae]
MSTNQLTIEDLKKIMRECAGEDDSISLEGDILDTPFMDLGYDSLALLETAALIKRQYGVTVSDEDLHGIDTPRAFLEKVNSVLV